MQQRPDDIFGTSPRYRPCPMPPCPHRGEHDQPPRFGLRHDSQMGEIGLAACEVVVQVEKSYQKPSGRIVIGDVDVVVEPFIPSWEIAFHPYLLETVFRGPLMRLDFMIDLVAFDRFTKQMGEAGDVMVKNAVLVEIDLGKTHLPLLVCIADIVVTLRIGFEPIDQVLAVAWAQDIVVDTDIVIHRLTVH